MGRLGTGILQDKKEYSELEEEVRAELFKEPSEPNKT